MNLESQVVSLELAKRLRELGIKQKSLFYWEKNEFKITIKENGEEEIEYETSLCVDRLLGARNPIEFYSAFTVAELGEMLPKEISYEQIAHYLVIEVKGIEWKIYYRQFAENEFIPVSICDSEEATARAKMLIHLIENKLIEV